MKRQKSMAWGAVLILLAAGCAVDRPAPATRIGAGNTGASIASSGGLSARSSTAVQVPTDTATALPPTDTPEPTATPTLAPDAWQQMPIIPVVSDSARAIYAAGQALGNDPHAFSIIGDCLSLPGNLFNKYGMDPENYNLGEYTYLQPVIDWFRPSFQRQSVTLGNGFTSAAEFSVLRADPDRCQPDETPLVCEYRIHKPSYVLIEIGTDDNLTPVDTYESRMRQIVEYTISKGIIPILATKADNREGNWAFDQIIAGLAYEYDVPLWNFWAAVQPLPNHGLSDDRGHLTWADPSHFEYTYAMQVAIPVRNLTALQALNAVWRGVTGQ